MLRALFWIFDRVPAWLRPAVIGALLVSVLTAGRVLLALPSFIRRPNARDNALWLASLAPLIGATAGLACSLVGRPLLRVPHIGPYLAGLVTMGAYMGAAAVLVVAGGEPNEPALWVGFGITAVISGLVVGHQWFRDEAIPPAP